MTDSVKPDWIAADWGTTHLRVWAMQGGTVLDHAQSDNGMAKLERDQFEGALLELIEGLDNTTLNTTNSGNVSIRAEVGGGIGDIYGTVWKTDDNGNILVSAEGRPLASGDKELLGNAQPDWIGG